MICDDSPLTFLYDFIMTVDDLILKSGLLIVLKSYFY